MNKASRIPLAFDWLNTTFKWIGASTVVGNSRDDKPALWMRRSYRRILALQLLERANVEDNGTLRALYRLADAGRVDKSRLLVLRTASNFTHPPKGKDAVWSLTAPYPADGLSAYETCYRVPAPVVHALIDGWDRYADIPPGNPPTW